LKLTIIITQKKWRWKSEIPPFVSSDFFLPSSKLIATHVNTENYSKELKNAIDRYLKKSKIAIRV